MLSIKTKAWLEVREQLVRAGYPHRTKGQLNKKYKNDSPTVTKEKFAIKRKTGGGRDELNTIDELLTDILGKGNSSLTTIPGGIDFGRKRTDRPETTIDNLDVCHCERQSTSPCVLKSYNKPALSNINSKSRDIGVTNQCQGDELDDHFDADSVNIKIEEPVRSEPAGARKMVVEAVYEQHNTEEHEMKMRILRKKEELVDLKLQYYGQKIARECKK